MTQQETSNLTDSFNEAAGTYETRMGTATRSVARHVAQLINLPAQARVCDNACGTGAVTEAVLETNPDATVDATDNSLGMIRIMSKLQIERGWGTRVQTQIVDSVQLPFSADTFDANIMSFGIFFTSDEYLAAQEIYRTLKPGGTAVVTCWKESTLFHMIFDVQRIVKPACPLQSLPTLKTWSKKETLRAVMDACGFTTVKMEAFPVDLTGPTIEELVVSCAENFKGMIGNQWTAEEKGKIDAATMEILRSRSGQYLSVNAPDCKGVRWVAWIATATK